MNIKTSVKSPSAMNVPFHKQQVTLSHEVIVVASIDDLKVLRGAWHSLARVAENASLYDTYEYGELAAFTAIQEGSAVNLALVREGEELVALWPVAIVRRGLLRVAQALTCGSGEEYGHPLIKEGTGAPIWAALLAAIKRIEADVLEVKWVPHHSALHACLEAAPQSLVLPLLPLHLRADPGYVIGLRDFPTFDAFTASVSSSLRYDLRKHQKRLGAKGEVTFGWCEGIEETDSLIAWVFEHKRAWAMARGIDTQYLMDDRVRHFFAALTRRLDLSVTPLVAFCKVDGVPVATSINLVGTKTVEGFISAYDEAYSDYSVGSLLLHYIAKWSHAHGRDCDMRPVHAAYKARWANRQTLHETRLIFIGVRGRLLDIALLGTYAVRAIKKLQRAAVRYCLRLAFGITRPAAASTPPDQTMKSGLKD